MTEPHRVVRVERDLRPLQTRAGARDARLAPVLRCLYEQPLDRLREMVEIQGLL